MVRIFEKTGLTWVVIATSLLIVGCGSGDSDLVQFKGRVTLNGGPWPEPGFITLAGDQRPVSIPFDRQGNFDATAFKGKQGLYPGTYRIGIECWEVKPTFDDPSAGKSAVPEKYHSPGTSELEVTIEEGKPINDFVLDIPTSE